MSPVQHRFFLRSSHSVNRSLQTALSRRPLPCSLVPVLSVGHATLQLSVVDSSTLSLLPFFSVPAAASPCLSARPGQAFARELTQKMFKIAVPRSLGSILVCLLALPLTVTLGGPRRHRSRSSAAHLAPTTLQTPPTAAPPTPPPSRSPAPPPIPRLRLHPLQLRLWQGVAVPPLQRHDGQRPVPQSAQLPHRRILRPLPPGGLPPVAPVRSFQQLPRPWYLKNVNMLIDEKGVQFSRHCEGCHNPVALFSGDLSQGMPKKRPFEDEGITCSTCHAIQSTDATGTGSYVMGIPAVLVDEKGAPVTRPVSDSEILAHLDRHSKAVMRPLSRPPSSAPPATKPPSPARSTTTSGSAPSPSTTSGRAPASPSSRPLPFYRKDTVSTCQTCHMPREPLPAERAGSRRQGRHARLASLARRQQSQSRLLQIRRAGSEAGRIPQKWPRWQRRPQRRHLRAGKGTAQHPLHSDRCPRSRLSALMHRFSLAAGETLIADVVIQNKGIAHSLRPRAARLLRILGRLHRQRRHRQGPRRERLHPAQRRTRSLRPLLHQPPRQHQRRTEWPPRDLAQPRAGLQQHHPVRPLAVGPLPLPSAQSHHRRSHDHRRR